MSNKIFAKEQVEEITQMYLHLAKTVSENVKEFEALRNEAKLPSEYVAQLAKVAQVQEDLNKAIKATEKSLKQEEKQQKKALQERKKREAQVKKESDLRQRLLAQRKKEEAAEKREQQLLAKTTGLYNKVQAGVNNLTKKYNDLAIRKELNGKLSAEENVTLGQLEAKLNKYGSALKKVDATIGKHQREVGNYKNGFDGLGFSVAQLSREMPAFANSMQTGFMAISNNIPMLVDEINKLKIANRQLTASGKPTVSIFKSLGKAIFGWQTLISVGVTLLTVYGAKLVDVVFATSDAEKATKEYNKQLEEENKNIKENIELRRRQLKSTRDFINDREIVDSFRKVLNDLTKDSPKAEAVLSELSDRLNTMGIKDSEILKDQKLLASDRLIVAVNMLEIEEKNIQLQEERIRLDNVLEAKQKILKDFADGKINAGTKQLKLDKLSSASLNNTIKIQKEIARLNQVNQNIIAKTVIIESGGDDDKQKQREDTLDFAANSEQAFAKQIEVLTDLRKKTEAGSAQWHIYNNLIKITKTALDALTGSVKNVKKEIGEGSYEFPDLQKNVENAIKTVEALRSNTDKFISSFSNLDKLGFGSLNNLFDGTFEKLLEGANGFEEEFAVVFNTVGDIAKDSFALISQLGQDNYDKQFSLLEQQKQDALRFAGDSSAAREEIEDQYEERRIKIANRQAKAQKDQALFMTAVTTAQAAISAYASQLIPGDPTSIIRAQIAAAITTGLGLAQIALISSKETPTFKDGVRGFEGGLAVVNDQKGSNYREYIQTPDGNMFKPEGRDVVMDLPKGTNVYTAKESNEFDKELDNILANNHMLPYDSRMPVNNIVKVYGGISAVEMERIMSRQFKKIAKNNITFDEKGIKKWVSNGYSSTVQHNNRVNFDGFSV